MTSPVGGLTALILAAGRGTRMSSATPKVLHPICGRPMIQWAIQAARDAGADRVICIVRPNDGVEEAMGDSAEVVRQMEGEGTAAAVLAAKEAVDSADAVLVHSADQPLIPGRLIKEMVDAHAERGWLGTVLTTSSIDPTAYGRVMRDDAGRVSRIVETKDPGQASAAELATREINLGTYVFEAGALFAALDRVEQTGAERYLPGVVPFLSADGEVGTVDTAEANLALGVNNRVQLMEAAAVAQRTILEEHARQGVTFVLPGTVAVDVRVTIGPDSTIWPGVTLRGDTSIGAGCEIGPQTTITDSVLGDGARAVHSFLTEATVEAGASLGPFAYLRPGAHIGAGAKIGTFVEIKNSNIGAGAKVPHLSYIGDADVGEASNLGAGNITANYDGRSKHRTTIGEGVRTGVDTSFIAPVSVGDGAYTGAGSVIDEDVPEGALGISRSEQVNVEGYAERKEKPPG